MQAPLPPNEAQRLEVLRSYCVLDTAAEAAFDDLIKLAALICGTPIALVSLLDQHRQWFKASVGLKATETSRDLAFCAHAILQPNALVVPDALDNARFAENALVTGAPHLRSYAGVPLINPEGYALGTLCVLDHSPRQLTAQQLDALAAIARQVTAQLELRRTVATLTQAIAEQQQTEADYRDLFEYAVEGLYRTTLTGQYLKANPMLASIYSDRGMMLAAKIHAIAGCESLPLVMLTSIGKPENLSQEDQLHFAAFLNKPIKAAQLYKVLTEVLAGPPLSIPQPLVKGNSVIAPDRTCSLRILLAEDHLVNQKIALLMLQRLGYRADVAGNGLEVLAALQRQPYDVVLLDVQMPEMDGLEAARCICQQWESQRRPHLIAMTANAMQGDREICLAAGMDDYISKPVYMEKLAQVLSLCQPLRPLLDPLESGAEMSPAKLSQASSPPKPDLSVLDLTVLDTFRQEMGDMGSEVIVELIACYLTEVPSLLQTIRTAINQRNLKDVQRVAHGLKASSASLGAIGFSQLCQKLETIALSAPIDQTCALVARLETEYKGVEAALKHEQIHQPS